jgi:FixJ family two-component response regulator
VLDDRDRASLSSLEEHDQWQVHLADDHSLNALTKLESPIIIWDRDLTSEDWRDVVHTLAALPQKPCVFLLSRVVDDYLWNEVVRVGGYDVLSKPLKEVEVLRAVRLAWSYWASTGPPTK